MKTFEEEKNEFSIWSSQFSDSAFPAHFERQYQSDRNVLFRSYSKGISKREYFAGLALQGILSNPESVLALSRLSSGQDEFIARTALNAADALLKELAK